MRRCLPCVPVAGRLIAQSVQKNCDVSPRQLGNRLLPEIGSKGHASANARMYRRFRPEKPRISGNSARRSSARRVTTLDPHAADDARDDKLCPMRQYNWTNWGC